MELANSDRQGRCQGIPRFTSEKRAGTKAQTQLLAIHRDDFPVEGCFPSLPNGDSPIANPFRIRPAAWRRPYDQLRPGGPAPHTLAHCHKWQTLAT